MSSRMKFQGMDKQDFNTPQSPKRSCDDKELKRLISEITSSEDYGSLQIKPKEKSFSKGKVDENKKETCTKAHERENKISNEAIGSDPNRIAMELLNEVILKPQPSLTFSSNSDDDSDTGDIVPLSFFFNKDSSNSRTTTPVERNTDHKNTYGRKHFTDICSSSVPKTSNTAPMSSSIILLNQVTKSTTKNLDKPKESDRSKENIKPIENDKILDKLKNKDSPQENIKPIENDTNLDKLGKKDALKENIKSLQTESKGCGQFQVISKKIFELHKRKYHVLSILGHGGSSTVYQVLESESSRILALKEVNLGKGDETVFENEIEILQKLSNSDRVVKMYDFEMNDKTLLIVLEKGDCDLSSILKELVRKGQPLSTIQVKYYWSELLLAVADVHKAGIIHLDLKPANFVQVLGRLKLIDFGIAGALPEDMTCLIKESQIGTVSYMAPEQISGTQKQGHFEVRRKSDVWALGCILYHLVYGVTPFQHIKQLYPKLQAITNPHYQIHYPQTHDSSVLDVLKSCLQYNPKNRPTIEELLLHTYLTGNK